MESNWSGSAAADVVAGGEGCHGVVEVVVEWLVWLKGGDLALSTPAAGAKNRFFRSTKLHFIVSCNKMFYKITYYVLHIYCWYFYCEGALFYISTFYGKLTLETNTISEYIIFGSLYITNYIYTK